MRQGIKIDQKIMLQGISLEEEGNFLEISRNNGMHFWQDFYVTGYTFGAILMLQDAGCKEIFRTPQSIP